MIKICLIVLLSYLLFSSISFLLCSYFLLFRQKKVSKEKAPLNESLRSLRASCALLSGLPILPHSAPLCFAKMRPMGEGGGCRWGGAKEMSAESGERRAELKNRVCEWRAWKW